MIIKTLKLKSGELIAAKLDNDFTLADFVEREKYVTLHDPIVYSSFRFLDPSSDQLIDTVSMAPLNAITDDRAIVIEASTIMFIGEIRPRALERYMKFLSQLTEYNNAGDVTMDEEDSAEDTLEKLAIMITPPGSDKLQ